MKGAYRQVVRLAQPVELKAYVVLNTSSNGRHPRRAAAVDRREGFRWRNPGARAFGYVAGTWRFFLGGVSDG